MRSRIFFNLGLLMIGAGASACLGQSNSAQPVDASVDMSYGCTVTKTASGGARIRCDDGSQVVIRNGVDGASGMDGVPGDAGPGGANGTGCTVEQQDAGALISCPDGSSVTVAAPMGAQGPEGQSARTTGRGFKLELLEAYVDAQQYPVVNLTLTDAAGLGLDRLGVATEGAVSPRFTIATLKKDGTGFSSYLLEDQTSPITAKTSKLATFDGAGEWTLVDVLAGTYSYRFSQPLPNNYDPSLTHRIGVWATRTFDDVTYADDDTFDFRPDGDTALDERQITTTETCNGCHDPLALHGEQRLSVELCVTCHTDQGKDPDTGNKIDFRVMIHKIHRGDDLPSVKAGTPYEIIGYNQSVHDYSEVGFPREINHCPTCHTGDQAAVWSNNPSIEACGACHDDVDFTLPTPDPDANDFSVPHPGGPRQNGSCTVCHAINALPGLSIQQSHERGKLNPNTPVLTVEIINVRNTAPTDVPIIDFRVRVNDVGRDLVTNPLDSFRFVLFGPNSGVVGQARFTPNQATDFVAGSSAGDYSYTFPDTIENMLATLTPVAPAAVGSFSFMAEGRHKFLAVPLPDGTTEDVQLGFDNPVFAFAVTDPQAVPRRAVVADDKCNACHRDIAFHGDNRGSVKACVACHNATLDTSSKMPAPPAGQTEVATSIRFGHMIHRIHGSAVATEPYIVFGYTGSPMDFSDIGFPGAAEDCESCHLPGTYDLPLPASLPPTVTQIMDDTGSLIGTAAPIGVTASNCTGCHDAPATAAHASLNTTDAGVEACATCHAVGKSFGVDTVHARPQWE